MSIFGALDTAATGVQLGRFWMDATSDNIANLNTVRPAGQEPFHARLVIARSRPGTSGVEVARVADRDGQPQVAYDPTHPFADADGNVTRPDVDMSQEMTNVLMATRLYQSNLSVIKSTQDMWAAALQVARR